MNEPIPFASKDVLHVYIGWDARDHLAYTVAVRSLMKHATIPVMVFPIIERDLRHREIYSRAYRVDPAGQKWDAQDGKPFSTDFSFTRFAVPALEDYADHWVLFTDPDVLWRDDVRHLVNWARAGKGEAVFCVQHEHVPPEGEKMDGVMQTLYDRKNWSSVMLMNPARCRDMTKRALNTWSGQRLHALGWVPDHQIGALPPIWNWLEGWSVEGVPKVVHFTRGTPDMVAGLPFADEWWSYLEDHEIDGYPLATRPGATPDAA